jgi:anti-sigma-K factor RskA
MAATPVDGHTQEFEQLAGLSALHVLEGDELARFERHAAQCEICQVMVRLDREALAQVSLVAPEMDPSPDFKARLMRRAAQELAAEAPTFEAQPPEPVELRPRRPSNVIPLWRRSPWVNAVAAVFVLGIATFGAITYENQPIATVELHGTAPGTAVVVVRRSGAAELEMRGVPDPGQGFIYEAWIIPPGKDPVAAGTTTRGEAKVPLEADPRGSTVAITRERSRVTQPTSEPVLLGEVRT